MTVESAVHLSASSPVRLSIRIPCTLDADAALAVLEAPEAPWLGERLAGEVARDRQFTCDLELGVGTGRLLAFRKSAIVTLGSAMHRGSGWQVPIEWRAASLAPLFPVFVGHLDVQADGLGLDGYYAPPLGDLGVVIDRAVFGLGARRVAHWFLTRVAAACT